ncbi:hypothetical protein MHD_02065 [Mannheimia granulomatis]|nr:hypothetical protein MHD_02065 [Mannheimia granulomatis]
MLAKVEKLIDEINKVHLAFSLDYFESGKIEKVNIKQTYTSQSPCRTYFSVSTKFTRIY